MTARRPWSAALGAAMLLFVSLALCGPAAAQDPTSSGTAATADEAVQHLLDILRDDAARTALIERLEAQTGATDAVAEEGPPTVARRVADSMASGIAALADQASAVWRELGRVGVLADGIADGDLSSYRDEALGLAFTILSTVIVFLGLSALLRPLARRLLPEIGAGMLAHLRATGLLTLARIGVLLAAWLTGYALASFVFGDGGGPSTAQSLYLNAFAVFGVVRVVLRAVVSPAADHEPSASGLAPGAQAVAYRSLRAVAGTVIQGYLFLVPLVQDWVGFAAARPTRTLVATLAAVLALVAIRRIARAVDAAKGDRATEPRAGQAVAAGMQVAWRRVWPTLAVAYVLYSWLVAVARPNLVGDLVLGGTLASAAALGLVLAGFTMIRAAPRLRMPLPRSVNAAVPRLGPRADRIGAFVVWALAAVMIVIAVLLVVTGWTAAELSTILASEAVQTTLWRVASAALVALAAAAIWAVVASWIDHRLALDLPGRNVSARSRTLLALFRNAFTIAVGILATMITLSQLGIDIAPLLAGAGVIGLAVGFGAQKLVQDIITGIFIQLENAMNEGDVVGVAGITGGVEKITIRSVRLRTLDGAAHVVPFSSVDTVTNLTRDFSYHVAEIGAAYKEKVSDVKAAMEEAFVRLRGEGFDGDILEPLEMQGVTMLGDSAVVVRARIKTLPGKQWGLGRRYTELVKEVMDERGLEIPFPHRQIVIPPGLLPLPAPRAEAEGRAEGT